MDSLHQLEDPPHRGTAGRSFFLVRKGLLEGFERAPEFLFRQSIDQKGQAHHHGQRHDPARTLQKERIGKEQGVFILC